MTFALQKRCSTTELSRHGAHRKHPQGQLQTVGATSFGHGTAEVALNGAWTQHKPLGDGFVAQTFKKKNADSDF